MGFTINLGNSGLGLVVQLFRPEVRLFITQHLDKILQVRGSAALALLTIQIAQLRRQTQIQLLQEISYGE